MEEQEYTPEYENEEAPDNSDEPNKKKNRGLKIFLIIISVLCLLAVGTTVAGVIYVKKNFNYKYNPITSEPEDLGFVEVKDDEIVNIALFGIDTTNPKSFKGRSDSIMILSINKTDKKIKLISVLRDSFVPIDRETWTDFNKINSAYAVGGPELAVKTLNQVFALDISEYATVNFYGMADIIDSMGGVEVPVTEAEIEQINSNLYAPCKKKGLNPADYRISKSGMQRLNGVQAVAYSRIRYVSNASGTNNDYGRTDRQRYVLTQLFKSVSSKSKSEYISLIKAVSPYCETSLSYTEILGLAVDVLLNSPTLEETRIPSTEFVMTAPNTNKGAINYYDLNFAANLVHGFIYEDVKPADFIKVSGIEKNDWYSAGYQPPKIVSYEERLKAKEEAEKAQTESSVPQSNTASAE